MLIRENMPTELRVSEKVNNQGSQLGASRGKNNEGNSAFIKAFNKLKM